MYSEIRPVVSRYYHIIMLLLVIIFVVNNLLFSPLRNTAIFVYLQAIIGSSACWSLGCGIDRISSFGHVKKLLSYFGVYSLQFYVNHLLIMLPCYYIASAVKLPSSWLSLFFIFMLGTFIAWIMLLIEKRWGWSKFLCGIR